MTIKHESVFYNTVIWKPNFNILKGFSKYVLKPPHNDDFSVNKLVISL